MPPLQPFPTVKCKGCYSEAESPGDGLQTSGSLGFGLSRPVLHQQPDPTPPCAAAMSAWLYGQAHRHHALLGHPLKHDASLLLSQSNNFPERRKCSCLHSGSKRQHAVGWCRSKLLNLKEYFTKQHVITSQQGAWLSFLAHRRR